MKFEGILPPLITPHHGDFSIDFDGVAQLLEHMVQSGVDGVIIGGTTGEYYAHTAAERVKLMRHAKDVLAGRLPLICGVGAIRTDEACDFAREARALGGDAILVNAPAYAVPTQQELAEHALAIDRAAGLPILLYNYPGRTGAMMGRDFLERVCVSANFRAIKESSGEIGQIHELANDFANLELICGADDLALEFYAWGACGWVCAGANCLPEAHRALHDACYRDNDFRRGRAIMSALMGLMQVLEQGGKFVQSVKYLCELAGLPAGPVRRPLGPLCEPEKQRLESVVTELKGALRTLI